MLGRYEVGERNSDPEVPVPILLAHLIVEIFSVSEPTDDCFCAEIEDQVQEKLTALFVLDTAFVQIRGEGGAHHILSTGIQIPDWELVPIPRMVIHPALFGHLLWVPTFDHVDLVEELKAIVEDIQMS